MCGVLVCAQKNSRNQSVTDYGSKDIAPKNASWYSHC